MSLRNGEVNRPFFLYEVTVSDCGYDQANMVAQVGNILWLKCSAPFPSTTQMDLKWFLTWSLEVPQLRWSIINFKDPVTSGPFSPAMDGHELPVLKPFHGMIKQPEKNHKIFWCVH